MGVRCLLLLLLAYHHVACQIQLTHRYPTPVRSIPLGIINNSPTHFWLLRYNKMAHDITIEKRRKPDGSVAGFVALRLDSVNASWFDYSQLDYYFFEKNDKLYFVFERVLNRERQLFMKEIDSLCKSSGFIRIASIKMDKRETEVELDFSLTRERQLMVIRTRSYGMTVNRDVSLYDPPTRQILYRRKLPPENPATGYSGEMCFDRSGQVYYLLYRYHLGIDFTASLFYGEFVARRPPIDSLFLVSVDSANSFVGQLALPLEGCDYMHAAFLGEETDGCSLNGFFTRVDSAGERRLAVARIRADNGLRLKDLHVRDADESLVERLTFYDGTDSKNAGDRYYEPWKEAHARDSHYFFSMRWGSFNYRELIWWQVKDGAPVAFDLVPRKTGYFENRVQFSSFGIPCLAVRDNGVAVFLLEHPANMDMGPANFVFRRFRRLESVRGARLAAYLIRDGKHYKKESLWLNRGQRCIPIPYSGTRDDVIFYFTEGDAERFGVLPLSRLW